MNTGQTGPLRPTKNPSHPHLHSQTRSYHGSPLYFSLPNPKHLGIRRLLSLRHLTPALPSSFFSFSRLFPTLQQQPIKPTAVVALLQPDCQGPDLRLRTTTSTIFDPPSYVASTNAVITVPWSASRCSIFCADLRAFCFAVSKLGLQATAAMVLVWSIISYAPQFTPEGVPQRLSILDATSAESKATWY